MARKASRPKGGRKPQAARSGNERERIIGAFMHLLAVDPIESIELGQIAEAAAVSLSRLRQEFDSKLAILAAQTKDIDRQVLEGVEEEADEDARNRLLDVLMRRLEAMQPHRKAVRSLMCSAICNPGLALALNALTARSMRWMLSAAGIGTSGPKGALRAQGLALIFAQVLRVWISDDDPSLDRTMAELDRALTRGQSWSRLLDDLCALVPSPGRRARRSRGGEQRAAA
ncbi:MAG TPA: TetR/AcrR family transcriptional regulator [Xanthobacteraceae bacterium]|nr:TetR/AcrR family transcriptional regulator [Xanthobacteraceae bacterium]